MRSGSVPRWTVAAMLLALPLAGCVEDAAEPVGTTTTNGTEEIPEELPQGREGTFNAFQETNKTEEGIDGMAHDHDYWLGRDRVEIFRERVALSPNPVSANVPPSQNRPTATFNMPIGALVFEGTSSFEFVVENPERHVCDPSGVRWNAKHTCNDDHGFDELPKTQRIPDPAPPTLHLQYLTAADGRDGWHDAGPLTWGTPMTVAVEPEQTDMPHSTTSLWRFRVYSEQPIDSTLTFEAAATIVRGDDVPPWPGHPDFYADSTKRLIFDGISETRERGTQAGDGLGYETRLTQLQPNRLISYGTRTVYVWINVTNYEAPPGLGPTHWYLYFHNATGDWWATNFFDQNLTVDGTKQMRFVIPVDDNGMDSPYAPESRWQFLLRGTKDFGAFTCYGGCATYRVEYAMKIVASSDVLAEEEYNFIQDA